MKVAYINTVCGFSSTGKLTVLLAENKKITSKVYYGRKKFTGDIDSFKFNNLLGNSIHAISTFLLDNHGFINKKETNRLIDSLKQFNPDVIHLHNLHGYYLHVGELFKYLKSSNCKVIWTLHDCWPFTGHCAYYDGINCHQWESECKNCPIPLNYPPTFNKYNANRNFHRKKEVFTSIDNMILVVPSCWLKNELKKSFLQSVDIRVISNGIDLSVFKPVLNKDNSKLELIAVASYWTKQKGLYDLIKFSQQLNDNEHLTVVGLKKKQFDLFGKNVTCIERTSNIDELVRYYSKAHYFINFTYEDNFPTVNIESLACGTPIITYNTGGSPEIINSTTGIVIDKGDYNSCLDIVRQNYMFKIEDCVKQAQKYSKEEMLNNYIKLYSEF